MPGSLHALLAARLDALDPAARRLVADAAVLGATFPVEALIAVSGQDGDAVRAALAELVRREVLSRLGRPAVPGTGQILLRSAHAAPGGLRDPVPAGPQGPPPGRGRPPARRLPRGRGGSRRRHRPPLPRRAARRGRRPRHCRDPRPGHRHAGACRRARRADRRPRCGRCQLRRCRRAEPGPAGRGPARRRTAVGRMLWEWLPWPCHQRRLRPGSRACGRARE